MRVLRAAAFTVFLLALAVGGSSPAFAITTPTPAVSPTAVPPTDVPATPTPLPPTHTASPTDTDVPSATPTALPTSTPTARATNTLIPSRTASPAATETVFQPEDSTREATASALAATDEPTTAAETPTVDGSGVATIVPVTPSSTAAPAAEDTQTPEAGASDEPDATRSPAILTEVESSGGSGGQTLLVAILIALGLAVVGVSQATRRK